MGNKPLKSIVMKDEFPVIYVPRPLVSPMTVKKFWYMRLWHFIFDPFKIGK